MPARATPKARVTRLASGATRKLGRQIRVRSTAETIARRKTTPAGPTWSKISVATAAPIWIEQIAARTMLTAGRVGRGSLPAEATIRAVNHPERFLAATSRIGRDNRA